MITQPENNIRLEENQAKAIEETKIRLLNLESEISIATKNLKNIRTETERATKENAYQNEVLLSLNEQIVSKQVKKDDFESTTIRFEYYLNGLKKEEAEIKETQAKKLLELNEREAIVLERERSLERRCMTLKEEITKQAEDRAKINVALEAFKEATKTVTWK